MFTPPTNAAHFIDFTSSAPCTGGDSVLVSVVVHVHPQDAVVEPVLTGIEARDVVEDCRV